MRTTTAKKKTAKKAARKRAPRKTTAAAEQAKLWRRELRSLETAQRRADREAAKEIRRLEKQIAKIRTELETAGQRRRDRIATLKGRLGL
jgi:nucleoside-triphosphatase THEP1